LALTEQAAVKTSGYAAGSLLTVADLPLVEVAAILAATDRIERMSGADRVRMLAGRRIALLFYESSTRTRTSFELAAKSLGAITTLVSDKSSSIEKGESLKDTGLTLRALGAECIILRHANSGAPYLLAKATGLPVLNAGDGMHEHPSQALLDLRTGVDTASGRWRVWLWGKNVTDKYYWIHAEKITDTVARVAGMPATFGISVSSRF